MLQDTGETTAGICINSMGQQCQMQNLQNPESVAVHVPLPNCFGGLQWGQLCLLGIKSPTPDKSSTGVVQGIG